MPSNTAANRKSKPAARRTSALEALRASGMVGMFAGAPDLASSRKRILKDKLRGNAGAAG
jgi:hypothetical protein